MAMGPADIAFVRDWLQHSSGNVLEQQREYAIESRLATVAERRNLRDAAAVVLQLREASCDPALTRAVLEALLNNETTFFRDGAPFEILRRHVVPEIMGRQGRDRSLSLWSAACSSGQELYSVAMVLAESFPELLSWQLRLVGTDLSEAILRRASQGLYSQVEVGRGLPHRCLTKYFDRTGTSYQIRAEIRRMAMFLPANLTLPLPPLPRMDVVFLRNALIYFDLATKRRALAQVEKVLKPGGYLFMGAAENTISLSESFERCFDKASCYRLRGP